jgi:hypothetical protein
MSKNIFNFCILSMNKCIALLWHLNKGSTVIFVYLFPTALLISLNFTFVCVLNFLSFRATVRFINPDDLPPPQLLRSSEDLLYIVS